MNNNFKNDKFVEVVQEFQIVQGQSVYQIGSIDLNDVYFFVKNGNENYKVLATGQYTVDGVNLTINDPNIILTNTHIQVCRVYSTVASKYISDVVNINTLREHYNVLVDDFINVVDFLRKSGIKSDSSAMNYVFPLLEEGQVFMRKGLGFEGIQIMDIKGELELQVNKAIEIFDKYLNEQKKPEIDNYVGEKETEIDNYIGGKETELENRLEIFTQEKIQQINDVGLKLEIDQTNHGFLFDAVQYDVSRGIYIKASAAYGADGMAVRINSNKFYLVSNGLVKVPDLAVDSGGRAYVMDEFYFLDNYIAGGCTPEKPTNIFQPLFCIVDKDGIKSALIQVDTPIDLEPREITELGLPNKENTIEDLIKSRKYKVGDVVQVLGYYSAGDGGGHARIKKPIGYNGSDAVIGADGSIWGIVHSGEVNLSWFGAKADFDMNTRIGTDCSLALTKALDYCDERQTTFLIVDGKYYLGNTITRKGYFCLKGKSYPNRKLLGYGVVSTNKKDPASMIYVKKDLTNAFIFEGEAKTQTYNKLGDMKFCVENVIFESGDILSAEYDSVTTTNCSLFSFVAKGAPSRPFSFKQNQVRGFDKVFNFYTDGTEVGTNTDIMVIRENEFSSNNYTIYSDGVVDVNDTAKNRLFAIGNLEFVSNISEQGGKIHILKGSGMGSVLINNNLLETNNDTLNISMGFGLLEVKGNYWEGNTGTINIEGYNESSLIWVGNSRLGSSHTINLSKIRVLEIDDYYTIIDECLFINKTPNFFFKDRSVGMFENTHRVIYETLNNKARYEFSALDYKKDFGDFKIIENSAETNLTQFVINTGKKYALSFYTTKTQVNQLNKLKVQILSGGFDLIIPVEFEVQPYETGVVVMFEPVENSIQQTIKITSLEHCLVSSVNIYEVYAENVFPCLDFYKAITFVQTLDTPYYTLKMQEQGVYSDYVAYRDELHAYENSNNVNYKSGIMSLNIIEEPTIPKSVEEFAKEYNLI